MIWIILAGVVGVAVVAWARRSQKSFEAEAVERRERQRAVSLEREEAALLARLKERKREE